jgi:pyridoxamine 5'-phosphate oxidase family protein
MVVGAARGMTASEKFRDARRRPEVAFVVDDLAAIDPWTPRGIDSCSFEPTARDVT